MWKLKCYLFRAIHSEQEGDISKVMEEADGVSQKVSYLNLFYKAVNIKN